jgi:hypothetical protein
MEIRAEAGQRVEGGVVPRLSVGGELVFHEGLELFSGLGLAAPDGRNSSDLPIEVEPGERRGRVADVPAFEGRFDGLDAQGRLPQGRQEAFEQTVDLRPQSGRRVFFFRRRRRDGDDDVRRHLDERAIEPGRGRAAPTPLDADVTVVDDDHGGVPAEGRDLRVRPAPPDDHRDAPPAQSFPRLLKTFEHEGVVTLVRLGIVLGQGEENDQRLP